MNAINLRGVWACMKHELRPMRAQGGGAIVNCSSLGGLVLYCDSDAPFFNGIVRIGEFDGEMDAIKRQSDDFSATVERAE